MMKTTTLQQYSKVIQQVECNPYLYVSTFKQAKENLKQNDFKQLLSQFK